jgi:hypothetical protein
VVANLQSMMRISCRTNTSRSASRSRTDGYRRRISITLARLAREPRVVGQPVDMLFIRAARSSKDRGVVVPVVGWSHEVPHLYGVRGAPARPA